MGHKNTLEKNNGCTSELCVDGQCDYMLYDYRQQDTFWIICLFIENSSIRSRFGTQNHSIGHNAGNATGHLPDHVQEVGIHHLTYCVSSFSSSFTLSISFSKQLHFRRNHSSLFGLFSVLRTVYRVQMMFT